MRNDLAVAIGGRLTYIRGHDLSQAAFALRIGIHKNTLGNYERGQREVGAEALIGLIREGWNANWVLTGEGPERLADLRDRREPASSQAVIPEAVTIAFTLVEEALGPIRATAAQHRELVTLVAELLADGLPEAKVVSIASRTVRAIQGGTADGGNTAGGAAEAGSW